MAAEYAVLEQERRREVARALEQLVQTEAAAVQQLVATLPETSSAGVLQQVQLDTESGVIQLAAFRVEARSKMLQYSSKFICYLHTHFYTSPAIQPSCPQPSQGPQSTR